MVFINKSVAKSANDSSNSRFGDSHHPHMRSGRPRGFLPDSDDEDNTKKSNDNN